MKIIKCIIVDDELADMDYLESLLIKLDNLEILAKIADPNTSIDEILKQRPELIFIAMEMKSRTGIEVVEAIRKHQFFPTFIFISAYNHYAINALKESAFDYFMKPVNLHELKLTIKRFMSESVNHKVIDLNSVPICTSLSNREKELLLCLLRGDTNEQIASKLFISKSTVQFHRKNILSKTESQSFSDLVLRLNHLEYTL